jgi:hypothetical protein
MRKIVALFFILITFSCNDGNFEIASFEFEDTVNYCGEYVLYRLSTNENREALIVTLTDSQIKNEDTIVIPVSVTATGTYTVTYRIFEDTVTSSYFCTVIPPVEPKTTKNWQGTNGKILVKNEAVYDEDEVTIIAYNHIIILEDLVLTSGDETLLFDPSYYYGEFQTAVPEEN